MTESGTPESVIIGPYRYAITVDHEAMERLRNRGESGGGNAGTADYHQLQITIDGDMAAEMIADTLLHEIMHCCYRVSGLGRGKITEEEAIEHMTPVLLDTLRRNPAVTRYLLEDETGHARQEISGAEHQTAEGL
jgi:hypothetical protein